MRSIGIILFAALLVAQSSIASADGIQYPISSQKDRFITLLDKIDRNLSRLPMQASLAEKIRYLDNESLRSDLSSLEMLARIYKGPKKFKAISDFYPRVKEFEDKISHMRDSQSRAEMVRMDGEKQRKKYEDLLTLANSEYQSFLTNSDWFRHPNSLSEQLRNTLNATAWPSLDQDRDILLKYLAKYLSKRQEEKYNLADVEKGMHELRRDARRLSYFNQAIQNLIGSSNNRACPIGHEVKAEWSGPPKTYSCMVSSCLTEKLDSVTMDMGGLKEQGGNIEVHGDVVPQAMIQKAQQIYADLIASKTYLHLAEQIRGCRSAQPDQVEEHAAQQEEANIPF